jgi:hypothetical protein
MFKEFFTEDNGRASSIRLTMFVVALTACGLAAYAVVRDQLDVELIGLIGTMLLIGIGAKTIQKFGEAEKKPT